MLGSLKSRSSSPTSFRIHRTQIGVPQVPRLPIFIPYKGNWGILHCLIRGFPCLLASGRDGSGSNGPLNPRCVQSESRRTEALRISRPNGYDPWSNSTGNSGRGTGSPLELDLHRSPVHPPEAVIHRTNGNEPAACVSGLPLCAPPGDLYGVTGIHHGPLVILRERSR
jgi:hypothetical protein